jgi:Restriction endonuclease
MRALAVHLFEAIPGCFAERGTISFFGAEQIDIAVGNPRLPDGLPLLPTVLLVECKDWARPVDSKTVGYFINILANRSVEAGVLIAANGITGDPEELSQARLALGALGLKLSTHAGGWSVTSTK